METPLAGPRTPERPLGFWAGRRAGRDSWLDTLPSAAYQDPVHTLPSVIGPMLLVSEPAGVKHVLLDAMARYPKAPLQVRFFQLLFGEGLAVSEGEPWRARRRLLAPAFETRSLAGHVPHMLAALEDFQAGWQAGETIDVVEAMSVLTFDIIARSLFSRDGAELAGLVRRTLAAALEVRPGLVDMLPTFGGLRSKARGERLFAPLDEAIAGLLARRRAGAAPPDDVLTRLIAAGLDDRAIRDEVVTLFLAGHETTALTLSWVFYVLSQRPAAEARLHAELDAVLAGRAPAQEDLPALAYTRAAVEETLRLYPSAGLFARQAQAADEICGTPVRRGQMIFVSPFVIHRHRRLWDEPDAFRPERFLERAERPRFAYMPFGGGPHICIGARFAMTEAVLALAALASRWRLSLTPDQDVALRHRVVLRPSAGLRMRLERR